MKLTRPMLFRVQQDFVDFVDKVKGGPWRAMQDEAAELLTRLEPHHAPEKTGLGEATQHHEQFLEEQDREREAVSEEVWKNCLARSRRDHRGHLACELCDRGVPENRLEPHHLEGGHGKRLQREWVGNVMVSCRSCHEAYHMNVRSFVAKVAAWCRAHLYPLPRRKEYVDA